MNASTSDLLAMNPFSAELFTDPGPFYKALRDEAPHKYYPEFDTHFFSRFDDVWEVLRIADNAFVATETNLPTPQYLRTHRNDGAPPFVSTNPVGPGPSLPSPFYEQMRLAHIAPLRPTSVAALREFVANRVRTTMDDVLARGRFDMVSEYAGMVTAGVVCHLFGIDTARARELFGIVAEITKVDPQQEGVDFSHFFTALKGELLPPIAARRKAGADGGNALIDGLINLRMEDQGGRALSDDEISDQLVCVMIAGMESASKVTAAGIMELWQRPDQLAEVRADPDRNVAIAVQEMVRFTAPAQYTFRTAHKDVEVGGRRIRAGQRIACLFRSAARDEREFPNPEEFIWNRPQRRVISFGLGQHHCIGKHLALLEMKLMVQEFITRVDKVEFLMDEAQRNPSCFQWGWIKLPVRASSTRA